MKNNCFIVILLILVGLTVNAQENILKGKVLNTDGNPVVGANLMILENNKGTSSDHNGEYVIKNLKNRTYFVQITYLGHQTITKQIKITDIETVYDVVFKETSAVLNEVVVTANQRLENMQETAAAVSSVSAKQVEQLQLKQFNELNSIAPNFRSYDDGSTGAFALIASRGISTIDNNPVVGLYVDDIPYFSTTAFPLSLADVQQIEVLRGPQGTLYGRNALAGVIKITTKKPTNTLSGFASTGFGNLNAKEFSLGFNTPVVKNKLFFKLNANINERDGFVRNTLLNKDLQNRKTVDANFRLKYFVNDRLSAALQYSLQRREANAYAYVNPGLDTDVDNSGKAILENNLYQVAFNEDVFRKALTQNGSLNLKYNFKNFSITSVTALQNTGQNSLDEFDYSPFDIQSIAANIDYRTISQELRLTSNTTAKFKWTTGVFLYENKEVNDGIRRNGTDAGLVNPSLVGLTPFNRFDNTIIVQNGIALYGQASYDITDKLTLTGGLRFDYEETSADVNQIYQNEILPNATFKESADFNAFSPKGALSYKPNENIFLFANVARGYRPGGINQFVSDANLAAFDPETTMNYEVGLKSNVFENSIKFNLTGFLINYTDQQVFTILDLSSFAIGKENIGESRSFGLELESQWVALPGLNFTLNLGYLNTEVLKYNPKDFATGTEVDLSGKKLPLSPKLNGNFNINYIATLSKKINFESSLDYVYQGDSFFDVTNEFTQEAYGLLNARIGLTSKNIALFVWGKNITDEAFFSYGYGVGSYKAAAFGLPQTYGVTLTAKF